MKKIIIIIIILFISGIGKYSNSEPMSPMIYGDVNLDNVVDYDDLFIVMNDAELFITGSPITDLDGNGITDVADILIVYNLI